MVLTWEHGLSGRAKAQMIGLSVGWTSRLRNAVIRGEMVCDGARRRVADGTTRTSCGNGSMRCLMQPTKSSTNQWIATDGLAITTFRVLNPDLKPEGKYLV